MDVDVARQLCIPGYRILRELGRGGIATVYLARQESLDRDVALKIMAPALVSQSSFAERFVREGQTVARLNHPGIVTIYDIEVADHQPYIAMEYLSGGSLKERMRARISPRSALAVIAQIAAALSYAHRRGVVHRDVKPENILFRGQKRAVLTDFGIAKTAASDPNLTNAGIVVGTPRYMSPEQADGRGADHRSDIYALGVILYELLTGTPPYDQQESIGLLYAHINEPIPKLPGDLSRLQHLLDGMMAKEPAQRLANCAEVLGVIREARTGAAAATTRLTPVPARTGAKADTGAGAGKLRWASALGLAALAGLVILAVWQVTRHAEPVSIAGQPAPAKSEQASSQKPSPEDAQATTASPNRTAVPTPVAVDRSRGGSVDGAQAVDAASPPTRSSPGDTRSAVAAVAPATTVRPPITARHIESLLKLADKQIEVGQLRTPAGDNAVETYRSVLRAESDHPAAVRGLRRVADEYAQRAQAAMVKQDYEVARESVRAGLTVVARHRTLRTLDRRIDRILEAQQQFEMGLRHANGGGVPRDTLQAFKHFSRAAALGHARAQYRLGLAYANGVGAVRDEEQALRWLSHAAQQGHLEARFNLGLGLLFGPTPDPANAARWMQRLGEAEYTPSYRVLGWMYGTGTGTERSIKKSLKWYFKRGLKNMFGAPALPKHVIPLWQEQFEHALSESTEGVVSDLQPG